jgi:RNA polymerase sigma-70 factor (ECF subfamily)
MAVLITSMSAMVRERIPEPGVKTLASQPLASPADADAQRLTAAIARGEEAAFREFYDRYQDRLFRFALVLGKGDEHLAHEVVQAAFLTAASKLRRVESEEHLWNWLARVARQHLGKLWRQLRRDSPIVGVEHLPESPQASEPEPVLEQNLDAALLSLPAEDRQLVEWFYFDGLSHKVIAEKLSATPKAVSCRLERVRARLRALVAQKGPDEI